MLYSTRSVPKFRTTAGSFRTSNRDEISTWSEPRVTTCVPRRHQHQPSGASLTKSVTPTYQRQETVTRQGHDVRLEDGRVEPEHLGVHVERRKSSRRDDDGREPFKDRGDGERRVEADKMEHRVGHCRIVGLERFEQEAEACAGSDMSTRSTGSTLSGRRTFVVGRDEGCERGDFLQRREFVDSSELECPDEGRESFGAEPACGRISSSGGGRPVCLTHLSGFFSMNVMSRKCCKNDSGVSATTWRTRIRVCERGASVFHLECRFCGPTAYLKVLDETSEESGKVFGATDIARNGFLQQVFWEDCGGHCVRIRPERSRTARPTDAPGFAIKSSSSAPSSPCCSPSTSLRYSSSSFDASFSLILRTND